MGANPTSEMVSDRTAFHSSLADREGPIPTFPPRALDASGRLIPISREDRAARSRAAIRTLRAIEAIPDEDAPEAARQLMQGIDENRPEGSKLFTGMH